MRPIIDLTDVARVQPSDMTHPMNYWIESGRGLVLLDGASSDELREMDHKVWHALGADPAQRVAALLRFRCLVQVFRSQRLKALLLQKGFALIAPALHVAATQRLNAERGFNPLKFERAVQDAMAALAKGRQAATEEIYQAAA